MTDQELKKLSRAELLEMLIEQSEFCDGLRKQLDQALSALQNRNIVINSAGTMAEAAMKLSGVFEAADYAAELYLENIQRMDREIEEIRAKRLADVEQEAERILADANRASAEILQKAERCYKEKMKLAKFNPDDWICIAPEAEEDK